MLATMAERLEAVRARSGLSVRAAAERANLHWTYVNRLHRGDQDNPAEESLKAVAAVYGTSSEYLRTGQVEVDLWADLTRDPQFKTAGMARPETRAEFILFMAAVKFPGHLKLEDSAAYLGLTLDELQDILKGHTRITDRMLLGIAKLTGAPVSWMRIGHFSFVPEEMLSTWLDIDVFAETYHRLTGNKK